MVTWTSQYPPLSESILVAAELILGVRLPEAYRAVAQQWPRDFPAESGFTVHGEHGSWGSCVGCLLSLDPRHSDNVFTHMRDGALPAGIIPIIDDGGGDLVCLDYRTATQPSVVYWAHEVGGEEGIVAVAGTFAAFLEMLADDGAAI